MAPSIRTSRTASLIVAAVVTVSSMVAPGPAPAFAAPAGPAGSVALSTSGGDGSASEDDAGGSVSDSDTVGTEAVDTVDSESGDGSIVQNPLGSQADDDEGSSADDDRKIWAIIGGLLLVAVALTVLTVRYWRHTKPVAKPAEAPQPGGRRARSASEKISYDDLGSDLFIDES